LTEQSLVQAIREIYNFFYKKTNGERYTKTQLSDCWKVFEASPISERSERASGQEGLDADEYSRVLVG